MLDVRTVEPKCEFASCLMLRLASRYRGIVGPEINDGDCQKIVDRPAGPGVTDRPRNLQIPVESLKVFAAIGCEDETGTRHRVARLFELIRHRVVRRPVPLVNPVVAGLTRNMDVRGGIAGICQRTRAAPLFDPDPDAGDRSTGIVDEPDASFRPGRN